MAILVLVNLMIWPETRSILNFKNLSPVLTAKQFFLIFFASFEVYFSIFKTLPHKIHILFFIKNNQCKTLKYKRYIN